jgi:hypothetical protein
MPASVNDCLITENSDNAFSDLVHIPRTNAQTLTHYKVQGEAVCSPSIAQGSGVATV